MEHLLQILIPHIKLILSFILIILVVVMFIGLSYGGLVLSKLISLFLFDKTVGNIVEIGGYILLASTAILADKTLVWATLFGERIGISYVLILCAIYSIISLFCIIFGGIFFTYIYFKYKDQIKVAK
jgi:hypothetical protein